MAARRIGFCLIAKRLTALYFGRGNLIPFIDNLEEIHVHGYPFVVHVTIVEYPSAINLFVPPVDVQAAAFIGLANAYGLGVLVCRYDPIVLSPLTPVEFHLENFERKFMRLMGSTDEVVIPFKTPYRRSRRNLDAATNRCGFNWWQAVESEFMALSREFASNAASNGMQVSLCSQPQFQILEVHTATCVDAGRLAQVSG